jgi:acylphosphatase
MPTIHLHITGKVQGVFYRASAKETAETLKLTGWIKNKKDNSVEARVTGDEMQLNKFIDWCKIGPEKAKVENVIIIKKEEIHFDNFVIVR